MDIFFTKRNRLSLCAFSFMIPLAVTMASSVRVGISLGARLPNDAKLSAYTGLFVCVAFMSFNALVMFIVKSFIARAFTNDVQVTELVSSVLVCAIAFQIFDGAFTCASGIMRGLGKQIIGAGLNFIGFFLVGIPLQLLLGFVLKLELFGVWAALAISLACAAVLSVAVVVFGTNWQKESDKAYERAASKKKQVTLQEAAVVGNNASDDAPKLSIDKDTELNDTIVTTLQGNENKEISDAADEQ